MIDWCGALLHNGYSVADIRSTVNDYGYIVTYITWLNAQLADPEHWGDEYHGT